MRQELRFGILRREVKSQRPTIADSPITIPATNQFVVGSSSTVTIGFTAGFSGVMVGRYSGVVVDEG